MSIVKRLQAAKWEYKGCTKETHLLTDLSFQANFSCSYSKSNFA